MPEYLSPGVYVEETDSGTKSVEGVSTSTAGFIGQTERGQLKPQLVTDYNDFQRKYGGPIADSYLGHAVRGFFENGGSRAYIARVTGDYREEVGTATLTDAAETDVLSAAATGPGEWAESVSVTVTDAPVSNETNTVFNLVARYWSVEASEVENPGSKAPDPKPDIEERYDELNADEGSTQFYPRRLEGASNLVQITQEGPGRPANQTVWLESGDSSATSADGGSQIQDSDSLSDESDDESDDSPSIPSDDELDDMTKAEMKEIAKPLEISISQRKAELKAELKEQRDSDDVETDGGAITEPAVEEYKGNSTPGQRTGLAAFEEIDAISIVVAPDENDVPGLTEAVVSHCENMKDRMTLLQAPRNPGKIEEMEPPVDSSYAAYYYPWIQVRDPEMGTSQLVPPGGHIAGIYARSDQENGIHKAPANEVVNGAEGLQHNVTKSDQNSLNPKGVNCVRDFQGRGIRVWGARTTASNPEWRYINVRRLFLYIRQSIDEGTQWAVFEPNDEDLWARVEQTIERFLTTLWRDGALMGTSEDEAFYVNCDSSTMTQDDIDNGRLICEIGIAPVKPAEFVVFRISQWTDGQGS